jgi:diguanylate cyclase (GGDEF)-like protein/PAS domain S-box-containing protein
VRNLVALPVSLRHSARPLLIPAIAFAPWIAASVSIGLAVLGIGQFAYQGRVPGAEWFLLPSSLIGLIAVLLIALQLRFESRAGREAERRAAQTEQRYAGIIAGATDLIAIVAADGALSYISPSVARLLGRDTSDLLGTPLTDLVVPGDQFHAAWLLDCARSRQDAPHARLRFRTALGDERAFDTRADHMAGSADLLINARDISEQVWLEKEQERAQTHDRLTGLLNRTTFVARLDDALREAARNRRPVTIAVLDLDHFGVVNDQLGEQAGDQILQVIAERLAGVAGTTATLARLAGDRFGLLVGAGLTEAMALFQEMREVIGRPVAIGERAVPIGASAGIASRGDGQPGTPDELISEAEAALLAAQQAGPGQVIIFAPNMAIPEGRLDLEADLRRAVERSEFTLFYQPVIGLNAGEIVEMEALVRWNHPTRGLVAPGDFIHVAEETGLIVPIGWWVLAEACRQGVRWLGNVAARPLTMSVNLSPRMFRQGDLVHRVRAILLETGFPADRLRLEITEGAMIEDRVQAATVLQALKQMGVQLAIDDFGTGYSSLAYLQHFPIDVIKIDRSFIASMADCRESSEIVRSIVGLAKRLNLETTGEGIETAGQLAQLRELGSDRGQGFLFSKPLPAADLDRLLTGPAGRVTFAA